MSNHAEMLQWIDAQHGRMRGLVERWASVNSWTHNLAGLATLATQLESDFAILGGEVTLRDLPPQEAIDARGNLTFTPLGKAISIVKRPDAPVRVFLGIHYDTVYPPDDPFQSVDAPDAFTLRGPGVIDAKGGLAVLLIALEALERSDVGDRIGWEVLLNPDEEVGSPGSAALLAGCAARNQVGLVFEPAFPDGSLVSERKGSGNFAAVIRGRSAHAGRDPAAGRNAVVAAADFALAAHGLNGRVPEATVNVGRIDGGGPVNVVPDLAIVRFNARAAQIADQHLIEQELQRIAAEVINRHEVAVQLDGGFLSPPKLLDDRTRDLCRLIESCGQALDIPIRWTRSGGVSDGNKLAAAGLPVIDTLGPVGGHLHSPHEYLRLNTLTERARLCALLLLRLAAGEASL
ncbi:MAG TPA: hydrolase [Tepidisphaeraceae bacterium]|jgi:glutamate carboxypeptidase